jgi:hypothetical protein
MGSNFDAIFAEAFWPAAKNEFSQSITYRHVGAISSTEVTAVLRWNSDRESAAVGRWPSIEAILSDFTTAPAKGDQIQIGSTWYTAYALHYGDDGSVRIEFNKIA